MLQREERTGEMMLLSTCVIEGLFPVISKLGVSVFPPLFFSAAGFLCAALIFAFGCIFRGHLLKKISMRALGLVFGVACFIVIPMGIILVGVRFTSGVNTALLLQAEMLFTFLYVTIFLGERLHTIQIMGALAVLLGAIFVLFNGTLDFNRGDLIIVAATAFFPIGNTFAKKALALLPSDILLLLRYAMGGSILMMLSIAFEDLAFLSSGIGMQYLAVFAAYVLLILVLSKLFWYAGLKRLPIGKSIYIISATPAFGLLFAFFFLGEIPTIYQIAGFVFSISGVYLLISRPKVASEVVEPV